MLKTTISPYHMSTVEVTEEDIKNGKPKCAGECALALALARHGAIRPEVGVGYPSFYTHITRGVLSYSQFIDGYTYIYSLSKEASQFVIDFDAGKEVSPFSFEAYIPKEIQQ